MREVAFVLTARPSYAKLKPVIQESLKINLPVNIYVCGSALLPRYGEVVNQVRADFPGEKITPVYSVHEGNEPVVSVLSTASLTAGLGREFASQQHPLVVVMADRHETLAASIAASYQNIPVAHLQGGEVSGNIDDKVRNANTMLARWHFPATYCAMEHIWKMTEAYAFTFHYGCPGIDVARQALDSMRVSNTELGGDGPLVDLDAPFAIVLYHPETDHPRQGYATMDSILTAVESAFGEQVVVFWPGQDAGMEGVSKAIREHKDGYLRTVRSLPPERFLKLLDQAALLVGNSSVGIRECSYLGTPVFNVGHRQAGRERAKNVVEGLPTDSSYVGRYPSSNLYGDGYAAPKIAAKLKELVWQLL